MSVPITTVVSEVSAALSATSLRHQVIASNIANRDTQGYQRLQVQFDRAMGAVVALEPGNEPPSIEQDLVALSANSTRYEALTRVLSRYFSIVNAIASYNRG